MVQVDGVWHTVTPRDPGAAEKRRQDRERARERSRAEASARAERIVGNAMSSDPARVVDAARDLAKVNARAPRPITVSTERTIVECSNGVCRFYTVGPTTQLAVQGPVDPNLIVPRITTEERLTALPARERAAELMRMGRAVDASGVLSEHADLNPDDPGAMRLAALASAAAGRTERAADALLAAYTADPLLAASAVEPSELGISRAALDRARASAGALAGKSDRPGPSLLAAVLAQSAGEGETAQRFLARAASLGLPHEVTATFEGSRTRK